MILSDKKEDKIIITGKLDDVVIEFMSIFDELYNHCSNDYKTVLLQFIVDKSIGKFDEEY